MITINPEVKLDGTAGGNVGVNPTIPTIQVAIAGRSTGIVTVTAKSSGSDVYEALQPALTLDLTTERTAVISEYSLESLNFVPDVGGADFTVTISQWENK